MDELKALLEKYGHQPETILHGGNDGILKLDGPGADVEFEFYGTSLTISIGIDGVGACFRGMPPPPPRHCIFCNEGYPAKNDEHSVFDNGSWKVWPCQK